jgi:hypothetical protein
MDEFTWKGQSWSHDEVEVMVYDSVVDSTECRACGSTQRVEPDAHGYECGCGDGTVHSPLYVLGLI